MSIIYSDRRGNARSSGQTTSNFLTQASWRLYEIRQSLPCLCTTSYFLINTLTIETFQAGHLGRHLATSASGGKYHWLVRQHREDRQDGCHSHQERQVRQDNQDRQESQDRWVRGNWQDRQIWHLNLTFRVADFPSLFFYISRWYLTWTNPNHNSQLSRAINYFPGKLCRAAFAILAMFYILHTM